MEPLALPSRNGVMLVRDNGEFLPHSLEAEQALIGCLLLDSSAWDAVEDVRPADFHRPDHQELFAGMLELRRDGSVPDTVTLIAHLQRTDRLEKAGGIAYFSKLARETPTAQNVRTYANVVIERARLRRLISLGLDITQAVTDGASSLDIAAGLRPTLDEFVNSATPRRARALDWRQLADRDPPERDWAESNWLGMGHVTLLVGPGGAGKTTAAQAWASCLALRREYLDWVPKERRVLMWETEDDDNEIWRRQLANARWLNVPLADFAGRLHVMSYDGEQVDLAGLVDQRRLIETPMMKTLREQIGDLRADVVILDNIARLYAGNENDRHQVTSFIAMLTGAAAPTGAAILLLGHPGKATGSEYSGSTAWEGAARSRLYLGRSLPDQPQGEDEPAEDDTVRYLCRRKANYSSKDWRRLHYRDGVIIPEAPPETAPGSMRPSAQYAQDVVAQAVRKLAQMGEHGVASSSSPKYLPRLASDYKLLDRLTKKDFAAAMRAMQTDQALVMTVVGKYSNRNPRHGLVLKAGT
jgi:AAA domain/DnaB-like helicase N terminal domain